jgi:hypothetical protein
MDCGIVRLSALFYRQIGGLRRGTCAGPSLNDLVRPHQERLGDRQAESLGALEVDDQLELRRLLNGEVGGLGALENLAT